MTNILVTGSNGQLGSEIKALSASYDYNFFLTDRMSLDITEKEEIKDYIDEHSIDIIINTAAYTAVDKAEEDKNNASKISCRNCKRKQHQIDSCKH
jgi:dTDP-4-dehydrorhamnose reductase